MAEEIMSTKEVAEYLGIHEVTVYKLANTGELPGFKVGGQWRFQKHALNGWMADETHKRRLKEQTELGDTNKETERDTVDS